ncbi:glycine/betaine ABC transporter permease, partial [Rhodovulum sp. YNF3179]
MATYDFIFDGLGLRDWCAGDGSGGGGPMSMADLVGKAGGESAEKSVSPWEMPFPSLDALNDACDAVPQSRELTLGLEEGFLAVKDDLQVVLDPVTQPLS